MKSKQQSRASKRQISILVQKVQGNHIQKQGVIVFINGNPFFLHEKFSNSKRSIRYYNNGITTSVNLNEPLKISFAIITPDTSKSYFVHALASYSLSHLPEEPLTQNIQIHTLGDLYTLYVSLYTTKSQNQRYSSLRHSQPLSLKKPMSRK